MKYDLKKMAAFGVAGNFTGHLEQAGEARDFTNVKVKEVNAPKAIFPTYLPYGKAADSSETAVTPRFLHVFPFDEEKIIFPAGEQKLQIEPECALIFDVEWKDGKVISLKPVCFGASNDCSIRKEGAKKISQKKNWSCASKGFSSQLIPVDRFDEKGIINNFRIASFLVRNGKAFDYGEDSAVRDYSYIYGKLLEWCIEKLNCQQNEGPAEDINSYLNESGCPEQIMISIGATRYTDFGEHNFLQNGDDAVVVVYDERKYSRDEIAAFVAEGKTSVENASILRQKIVL